MSADEVLALRGRNVGYAVTAPEWIEYGQSARWHYADCIVELTLDGQDGPYRVSKVVEREEEIELPAS